MSVLSGAGTRPGSHPEPHPATHHAPIERAGLRRPLLGHVVGAVVLGAAVAWRARTATADALRELGLTDPGAAVVVVGLLTVAVGVLLLLSALALGVAVLHVTARLAGSDASVRTSARTYLIATWPLWVRNLLVAVALVLPLGLDPARLAVLAVGDPFLLLAGWLVFRALRNEHRLSAPRAAVVAAVTMLGGVAIGLAALVAP